MWVAVVFETILHSPEMDPKILYPTLQKWILKNYFPLSQHESTLHNIYIQNFWSLGNADTPLLTRGIWKYLFRVAVEFETIFHSGFALLGYVFPNSTATHKRYFHIPLVKCGVFTKINNKQLLRPKRSLILLRKIPGNSKILAIYEKYEPVTKQNLSSDEIFL